MSQAPDKSQNQRIFILAAIAGALALAVIVDRFVLSDGPGVSRPTRAADAAPMPRRGFEPYLEPFSSYADLLERPVFAPSRRPPVQAPDLPSETVPQDTPAQNIEPQSPPEFEVVGIATGAGGEGSALIADERGETRRYYVGERIEDWQIEAITPRGVVVVQGDSRWRLPLAPVR